jgi:membrane protein implicated in regulation of membrane protease activity
MLFILEFLPSWVFLLTLGLGVIGLIATYFLKFIPIPALYFHKTAVQLVSVVVMLTSTFLYGGAYNNDSWMAKVKEMEDKVAVAEEQAKKENVRIEEKIVETTKEIKVKGDTIVKEIQVPGPERIKEITKDMSEDQKKAYEAKVAELENAIKNCPIPSMILEAHNKAVNLVPPAKSTGEKK